jgi:predicted RNase H-like HicB family nuclease
MYFFLPKSQGGMIVAEALDFPGAVSQGSDLPEALAERETP